MLKNKIPSNPLHLEAFITALIAGDDKHQADGALPPDVRAALIAAKSDLGSHNKAVQLSKGQYRQDSQGRRDYLKTAMGVAEQGRDYVFARHGHKAQVLVDYNLIVRRKARKAGLAEAGAESGVPMVEHKLERAQSRLSRAQAQLERANARLAKAQALVARREAEAALAAEVAPPEPPAPPSPKGGEGDPPPKPSS